MNKLDNVELKKGVSFDEKNSKLQRSRSDSKSRSYSRSRSGSVTRGICFSFMHQTKYGEKTNNLVIIPITIIRISNLISPFTTVIKLDQ